MLDLVSHRRERISIVTKQVELGYWDDGSTAATATGQTRKP